MAIAKEDIKPGYYWVREIGFLQLELVKVFNQQLPYQWGDDVMVAARLETKPWWKANEDRLDNYGSRFEFVARIEPPEDV